MDNDCCLDCTKYWSRVRVPTMTDCEYKKCGCEAVPSNKQKSSLLRIGNSRIGNSRLGIGIVVVIFVCNLLCVKASPYTLESEKSLNSINERNESYFTYHHVHNDENSNLKGENFHENLNDEITFDEMFLVPTEEEKMRIEWFDPARLNYTALRIAIDKWIASPSQFSSSQFQQRSGRFLGESHLPSFLTNLGKMLDFEQVVKEIETSIMSSVSCNACKGGMGLFQHYLKTGKARGEIILAASKLCASFKIETPRVCYGIINLMADEVIYVGRNVYMTPEQVCGFVIGDVCGNPYNPYHEWQVVFPPVPKPPLPPHIQPRKQVHRPLKVLHISDTHFDPYYLEGSNAECGEPLCCRETNGMAKTKDKRAGFWGDYRKCDTPERTIISMLEHIKYVHPDVDYILWTGDLPPHDIWNQTKESNTLILRMTVNQLITAFPNTPIFPALGNHESAPVNSFPPPNVPDRFGVQWLYNELNLQWQRWLPKDTAATILRGGFYSVLVRPRFRIISINTNFCNNKNWWLLVDSKDPAEELQWLIYELQGAEMRDERVHIIGHIPPGHPDCLKVWSHNYYEIINRYESTIAAQFFGHTHYDEYEIFYDNSANYSRATSVAFVGPSITTYEGLNPGYRLYAVDKDTQNVLDHETWVMDLAGSNRRGRALWFKLYSARAAYNLRSMHPQEWDSLILRMTEDDELFQLYYRFYWKSSPARHKCDQDCKKRLLCDLKSGRSHDRIVTCAKVEQQIEAKERGGWGGWIFSGITVASLGTWWLWG